MIKIQFFRKNFLQRDSAKVPPKRGRSRMPDLFYLTSPINCMLKKVSTTNLAAMYVVGITAPSLSVIDQLKLAVATTEIKAIRAGFYLINPPLILCVKV